MKFHITSRAAHSLGISMIAARTFMTLAVDGAAYMNSGWACVPGGWLLSLPLAIVIDKCKARPRRADGALWRAACGILAAALAYEAAAVCRLLVNSVSFVNLQNIPATLIMLVMLLVCLYTIMKNGRGAGNAARIWLIIFCVLFLIMAAANFGFFMPRWLLPVLGPGIGVMIEGSISTAGSIACGAVIHLLAQDDNPKPRSCVSTVTIGAIAALILCAYRGMLTPAQIFLQQNRLQSIETLLANGRTSLSVQLPTTFAWFMAYIVTLTGYGYSASAFCQTLLPNLHGRYCAIITLALAFAIASFGFAESEKTAIAAQYEYIVFAVLTAVAAASALMERSAERKYA